jgi:hypothetical protein
LEDLVVKIISPLDAHYENFADQQQCINYTVEGEGCVLVKLAEHKRLWDELSTCIKTDRFLKQNSGQRPEQEHLLREKQMENIEREKRLRHDLEDLFVEADIYAIGTKLANKSAAPSTIIEEAYKYVIENTFSKLNMLKPTTGEVLRELQAVLMADDMAQIGLDLAAEECNPEATREVEQYITLKVDRNEAVYLRDVVARFSRRPFGWPDNEVILLAARLGLAGKINFSQQGADLSLKKAYEPFTSVRKHGELRIQKIRQHDDRQLKKSTQLVKELFAKTFTGSSEKELYELIREELGLWNEALKSFNSKAQTGNFPGQKTINDGLALISGLLEQGSSFAMIQRFVDDASTLQDFAEDFEDLDDFYNSQFQTWQALAAALNQQFKANRSALEKQSEANKALLELEQIYRMDSPYGQLRHINPLIEKVQKVNANLIAEKQDHGVKRVDERIERVTAALLEASAPDELRNQSLYPLQQCKQRIKESISVSDIFSEQNEASSHEESAEDLINNYIAAQRQKDEKKVAVTKPDVATTGTGTSGSNKAAEPVTPVYGKRTVSLSPASMATETFIETEEQVDQYINKVRDELIKAVKAGDRVRIK